MAHEPRDDGGGPGRTEGEPAGRAAGPYPGNIGPEQRRLRRNVGVGALLVGVLAAAGLVWADAESWARALVFLPFVMGFTGVLQAREKT